MCWCARPQMQPPGGCWQELSAPLGVVHTLFSRPTTASSLTCPVSHYLDSAPISAPADSNRLDWVLKVWQRPLWQLAAEAGREEKELFQWLQCLWFSTGSWAHAWVTVQQHIHFHNLSISNGRHYWHPPLGRKEICIYNYLFLSILYCRCTYTFFF